ncbi:hypothetical protein CASFOL_018353 [Castilleja foliolosa]|uniref:Uncharacterized protein n=1 Tax=Castilleja foliolosa TaxID=1961234 RepID=A0ABD3D6G8_9LAMI
MSPLTQSNPSPIPNPTRLPRSKSARNRPPPFSDENHMPEINRSKNHHQRVKQQNGEPGSAFRRLIRAVFRKPKKRRVNGCDEEANDAVFKSLFLTITVLLSLERANHDGVELSRLRDIDRVRHGRILQQQQPLGVVDFPLEGTYDPYLMGCESGLIPALNRSAERE